MFSYEAKACYQSTARSHGAPALAQRVPLGSGAESYESALARGRGGLRAHGCDLGTGRSRTRGRIWRSAPPSGLPLPIGEGARCVRLWTSCPAYHRKAHPPASSRIWKCQSQRCRPGLGKLGKDQARRKAGHRSGETVCLGRRAKTLARPVANREAHQESTARQTGAKSRPTA